MVFGPAGTRRGIQPGGAGRSNKCLFHVHTAQAYGTSARAPGSGLAAEAWCSLYRHRGRATVKEPLGSAHKAAGSRFFFSVFPAGRSIEIDHSKAATAEKSIVLTLFVHLKATIMNLLHDDRL